ncbi:PREDICTED: uncharacterized protein LOC109166721 [Ipomoea nil]|uniref:uncharacterized protein LOC109166721 n=1 Tax=Ipomoea nil TaxID=35883 RepID=UPI0009008A2B|nr:PREDICTED: uncharacterized protein LOC109166721 [Ipomoea nil]
MSTTPAEASVVAITERWADMALGEDDFTFEPAPNDVQTDDSDTEGTWQLVGRFLTRKMVKIEFMSQVLASVWQPVKGMQVTEVQPRFFMFFFHHRTDIKRVMERPWAYDNATLVCRQLTDEMLPGDVSLDTLDMWVQVHALPMGYTSDKILEQIGNTLGSFIKVDDRFVNAPWKEFYRIRVAIPIDQPLRRRMRFMKRDKSTCWVGFKYERLHNFCFFCGKLGHLYKFCLQAQESTLGVEDYSYSAEMRAGFRRGPSAVGESWLIPPEGQPRVVTGEKGAGVVPDTGPAVVGDVWGDTNNPMVAVAKRRREELLCGRRTERQGEDNTMTEVPKNLFTTGSVSQTRPSL